MKSESDSRSSHKTTISSTQPSVKICDWRADLFVRKKWNRPHALRKSMTSLRACQKDMILLSVSRDYVFQAVSVRDWRSHVLCSKTRLFSSLMNLQPTWIPKQKNKY